MDIRYCETCGEEIPYNPKKGPKGYSSRRYCSKGCINKDRPQKRVVAEQSRLKPCEVCGKIIPKERNRNWNEYAKKRFCSHECSGQAQSHKIQLTCIACGKVFQRSPGLARSDNTYCSKPCRRKRQEYTCEICGKTFIERPSMRAGNHVYCDKKCQGIAKRKNKPQSQGRRSPEDLAWKMAVLKRDDFHCQHCGTDRKLEAHHIKEAKDFPELRHELSNGLTLCHQCHYYGVHKGMPNFIHGRYSKQRPQIPAQQEPV
jgi:HNH endonuclease